MKKQIAATIRSHIVSRLCGVQSLLLTTTSLQLSGALVVVVVEVEELFERLGRGEEEEDDVGEEVTQIC